MFSYKIKTFSKVLFCVKRILFLIFHLIISVILDFDQIFYVCF